MLSPNKEGEGVKESSLGGGEERWAAALQTQTALAREGKGERGWLDLLSVTDHSRIPRNSLDFSGAYSILFHRLLHNSTLV